MYWFEIISKRYQVKKQGAFQCEYYATICGENTLEDTQAGENSFRIWGENWMARKQAWEGDLFFMV